MCGISFHSITSDFTSQAADLPNTSAMIESDRPELITLGLLQSVVERRRQSSALQTRAESAGCIEELHLSLLGKSTVTGKVLVVQNGKIGLATLDEHCRLTGKPPLSIFVQSTRFERYQRDLFEAC